MQFQLEQMSDRIRMKAQQERSASGSQKSDLTATSQRDEKEMTSFQKRRRAIKDQHIKKISGPASGAGPGMGIRRLSSTIESPGSQGLVSPGGNCQGRLSLSDMLENQCAEPDRRHKPSLTNKSRVMASLAAGLYAPGAMFRQGSTVALGTVGLRRCASTVRRSSAAAEQEQQTAKPALKMNAVGFIGTTLSVDTFGREVYYFTLALFHNDVRVSAIGALHTTRSKPHESSTRSLCPVGMVR